MKATVANPAPVYQETYRCALLYCELDMPLMGFHRNPMALFKRRLKMTRTEFIEKKVLKTSLHIGRVYQPQALPFASLGWGFGLFSAASTWPLPATKDVGEISHGRMGQEQPGNARGDPSGTSGGYRIPSHMNTLHDMSPCTFTPP